MCDPIQLEIGRALVFFFYCGSVVLVGFAVTFIRLAFKR